MRHIFSFIVKALLVLITTATLVACDADSAKNLVLFESVGDPDLFESDVKQNVDRKSYDVEVQTSEELSLTLLQPTFFAFIDSPLYRFLDAGDLPQEGVSLCQNQDEETPSVFDRYSYTRVAGEPHKVGDELDIDFGSCRFSTGEEVSGSLSIRYKNLDGLNDTFLPVSTAYCVQRLQETKDGEPYSTLYVVGDEVIIKPFGDNVHVEVVNYAYDSVTGQRIEELQSSHIVPKSQPTLIINERTGLDDSEVTSIEGGDQIIFAHKGEQEPQHCQYYEREVNIDVRNFKVKDGVLTTTLNGSITLTNVSRDGNTESFNLVDSDLRVSVEEGQSNREFSIEGFNVQRVVNPSLKTYAIGFSGLVSSPSIDGVVSLDSLADDRRLQGDIGDYPSSGYFYIYGAGLEQVILQANPESLRLSIDYDGDDLRGFSVADYIFATTWTNLLNRDYQRADYIPDDEI